MSYFEDFHNTFLTILCALDGISPANFSATKSMDLHNNDKQCTDYQIINSVLVNKWTYLSILNRPTNWLANWLIDGLIDRSIDGTSKWLIGFFIACSWKLTKVSLISSLIFYLAEKWIKIVLLWTFEISVCLVYGYLCHFRLEPFKTLQSNASALWKTQE